MVVNKDVKVPPQNPIKMTKMQGFSVESPMYMVIEVYQRP